MNRVIGLLGFLITFLLPFNALADNSGTTGWNGLNNNLYWLNFINQSSTPSTHPPSGDNYLYFKSDNNLYSLDSSGSEIQISGNTPEPGGENQQIQYNDEGSFGGANIFTEGNNLAISNGYGLRFNGLGDANWQIGRNLGILNHPHLSSNTLQFVVGNGSVEGFVFGNNGGTNYLELDSSSNAWFSGNVNVQQNLVNPNYELYSNGSGFFAGGYFSWDNNGNISMGTDSGSSTTTPLHIDMGGTYSSTAGSNPKLILYDGGPGSYYGLGVSASELDIMSPANAQIAMFTNLSSTPQLVLSSNGYLGIGQPSPNYPLDVEAAGGSGGTTIANFSSGDTWQTSFNINNTTTNGWSFNLAGDGNYVIPPGALGLYGPNGFAWTVNTSGNVGIGQNNPVTRLHVSGGGLQVGDAGADQSITFGGTNAGIYWGNPASGADIYYNAGTLLLSPAGYPNALALQYSTGYLGILTTSPSYPLDVNGSFAADNHAIHSDGSGNLSAASVTVSNLVKLPVQTSGNTPTCGSSQNGALALTHAYILCVCNGSSWVQTSNGSSSCTF